MYMHIDAYVYAYILHTWREQSGDTQPASNNSSHPSAFPKLAFSCASHATPSNAIKRSSCVACFQTARRLIRRGDAESSPPVFPFSSPANGLLFPFPFPFPFPATKLYQPRQAAASGWSRRPPSSRSAGGGSSASVSAVSARPRHLTEGWAVHVLPSQTRQA